jgi:hypothetical protein
METLPVEKVPPNRRDDEAESRFREAIRARLQELGRNPFEAARIGGLDRGFINDLLSGAKRSVRARNIAALAKALDWSPEKLLGVSGLPARVEPRGPAPSERGLDGTDDLDGALRSLRRLLAWELERRGDPPARARTVASILEATARLHPGLAEDDLSPDLMRSLSDILGQRSS